MAAVFFISNFFFLFLLKLQQVCGFSLKKFSAKVVPLAILRSCSRFENMPNTDMCSETSSEKNKFKNIFFSLVEVQGGGVLERTTSISLSFFFHFLNGRFFVNQTLQQERKNGDLVIANLAKLFGLNCISPRTPMLKS